ncbi:MAG: AraC family transcriptional regulator, partial [Pseudomonadota bacterium]
PAARRRALLAGAGVDPDAPVDPKRMISDDVYYSLCERAARADPDGATLPLRVGDRMRADDYGAFGLAWKSAVDLRGSYQRAERYGRVLTSVSSYTLDLDAGRAFMTLRRDGERRLGLRLSNEQTLVAIVRISREISRRPFAPRAVHFRHPAPGDVAAHEAYFGCPALFGADRDAIELDETALDAPNRLGDPRISEFFDAHLAQELAALAQDEGLERRVRIQIAQALSAGPPTLAEIAARMSMSARTLQRRLAERGCAFQDLADAARRELAERLLRRTDYALAEVAFLTGFSDQSAFTRAFKRWSGGRTPAGFRRDAAAGG